MGPLYNLQARVYAHQRIFFFIMKNYTTVFTPIKCVGLLEVQQMGHLTTVLTGGLTDLRMACCIQAPDDKSLFIFNWRKLVLLKPST